MSHQPEADIDTTTSIRKVLMAVAHARAAYAAVEGAVVAGVPWEAILDYAQRGRFDLVMVGTHGRRGMKRVLLGSVAEKVVRMSPVPVLTIPCHSTE